MPVATKSEKITLVLDSELAAQVADAGRALGLENRPEAIRMLLHQAVAAFPWDSPSLLVAQEAMNAARHWAFSRLRMKLVEMEQELDEAGR